MKYYVKLAATGRVTLLALVASLFVTAHAGATTPAYPASEKHAQEAPGSVLLSLAKEWFYAFEFRKLNRKQLDARVDAQLTDAIVASESARLSLLGNPTSFELLSSEPIGNLMEYDFQITFRRARVAEYIALDKMGKVAGIGFQLFLPK
jgi:hypothetical protein